MSATIVNEMTYTVWCSECPFSTEPTIHKSWAEADAAAHDRDKHPESIPAFDDWAGNVARAVRYGQRN